MAISDAQYQQWLESDIFQNEYVDRTLLVEAKYYNAGEQTVYWSIGGYISGPSDTPANIEYEDSIKSFPSFSRSMSEAFTGKTRQSYGDIRIFNMGGEKDDLLTYAWNGREIKLLLGDRSWSRDDFREILVGKIAEISSDSIDTLSLKIRDKGIVLDKQLTETTFTTGPSTNLLKPVCYGQCYKIEPVLEDHTTHKYRVHDGAVSTISTVYDQGVSISFTPNTSDGSFTLSAQPAGQITADVEGATFVGLAGGAPAYYNTIAQIIYDIIVNRSDLSSSDVDTTNLSSFDSSFTQTVGFYTNDKTTLSVTLDKLVASVGGYWGFNRAGKLTLGQLDDPSAGTSVLTIGSDDIIERGMSIKARTLPYFKVTLGHTPYFRTQTTTELAGSVDEEAIVDLGQPYRLEIDEDVGVKTANLLAIESPVFETLLTNQEEANGEATRRLGLFDSIRTVYFIDGFTSPFKINIGDVITIDHNRFGFDGGQKAVVVDFTESITNGRSRIQLGVWK